MTMYTLSPLPDSISWKQVTGPSHTQGEEIMQRHEFQEVETMEGVLRVCPLRGLAPGPRTPTWGAGPPLLHNLWLSLHLSASFWPVGFWVGKGFALPQACLLNSTVYKMLPFCAQKPGFWDCQLFLLLKVPKFYFQLKNWKLTFFCSAFSALPMQ